MGSLICSISLRCSLLSLISCFSGFSGFSSDSSDSDDSARDDDLAEAVASSSGRKYGYLILLVMLHSYYPRGVRKSELILSLPCLFPEGKLNSKGEVRCS